MPRNRVAKLTIFLFTLFLLICCNGGTMAEEKINLPSIDDVPASMWARLSQKSFFFGHQSVGFNIIDGIRDVMKEHLEIKLKIVESSSPDRLKPGVLEHSRVGKNTQPKTKVDEFVKLLRSGIGNKANYVFLKFCYVDIRADSDVDDIFTYYTDAMAKLRQEFPNITIIHFTVPVTLTKTTWKTWIKKLIGKKEIWEYDDNIKRNEYNKLLMNKYSGKEPVFDLAKMEATFPDGRRSTFTKDGKTYYSLVPQYTTDGGHLNEVGRKFVAEQFLIFLARLCEGHKAEM